MGRVAYLQHNLQRKLYDLIQWRDNAQWVVLINPNKHLWRTVYLHWVNAERSNFPCTGKGCKLCNLGSKLCTYVPVLARRASRNGDRMDLSPWRAMIMPVNEGSIGILSEESRTPLLTYKRGKANSSMLYRPFTEDKTACPPVPDFEIQETLERVWGSQTEYQDGDSRPVERPNEIPI